MQRYAKIRLGFGQLLGSSILHLRSLVADIDDDGGEEELQDGGEASGDESGPDGPELPSQASAKKRFNDAESNR